MPNAECRFFQNRGAGRRLLRQRRAILRRLRALFRALQSTSWGTQEGQRRLEFRVLGFKGEGKKRHSGFERSERWKPPTFSRGKAEFIPPGEAFFYFSFVFLRRPESAAADEGACGVLSLSKDLAVDVFFLAVRRLPTADCRFSDPVPEGRHPKFNSPEHVTWIVIDVMSLQ